MNEGSDATASVWMTKAEMLSRLALATDITADVCVVGAGIAGLTTAYVLAVAAQFGDYATAGDVEKADDLAADTGGVIRRGLKKVAAYRTLTVSCTNARPYALTSAASCAGITQKRPGIVSVTALASTHTEKFSTDRRTLHWDLLNKEADFRGRQVVRDQTARIKETGQAGDNQAGKGTRWMTWPL